MYKNKIGICLLLLFKCFDEKKLFLSDNEAEKQNFKNKINDYKEISTNENV